MVYFSIKRLIATSSAKVCLADFTVDESLSWYDNLFTSIAFNRSDVVVWICGSADHGVILETQRHHLWYNLVLKCLWPLLLIRIKWRSINLLLSQSLLRKVLGINHQFLLWFTHLVEGVKLIKVEFFVAAWALLFILLSFTIKPFLAAFKMEKVLTRWNFQNLTSINELFDTYDAFLNVKFVLFGHLTAICCVL